MRTRKEWRTTPYWPNADAMRKRREELGLSLEDAALRLDMEAYQLDLVEHGKRTVTRRQAMLAVRAYGLEG